MYSAIPLDFFITLRHEGKIADRFFKKDYSISSNSIVETCFHICFCLTGQLLFRIDFTSEHRVNQNMMQLVSVYLRSFFKISIEHNATLFS